MKNFKNVFLLIFVFSMISGCKDEVKPPISYDSILAALIQQEDTDQDKKITIDDKGPKKFEFENLNGKKYTISGTYHLSNLLQELAIIEKGDTVSIAMIKESPTQRISRLIKTKYWNSLTRSIDKKGLKRVLGDAKAKGNTFRLYVPNQDSIAFTYFKSLEQDISKLKVVKLPKHITPEYVKSINKKPGILNLASSLDSNGDYIAKPFVVPGGRFNEMYGWDSYFESVGLLIDSRIDLAKSMSENFSYQIQYYGKILNANRSYYLTRTQPPFFSSLLKDIYESDPTISKSWLAEQLKWVIQEYEQVWMEKDVRLTKTGLNRYFGEGIGIPPETEEGHFNFVLKKFADKHKLTLVDFVEQYTNSEIEDKELDVYFTHDRSMRESGHDTSNRLDAICTDLNTVGLNSLLFKYETDIAFLINEAFGDQFLVNNKLHESQLWLSKAQKRKDLMNEYLWNEQKQSFYDYNFNTQQSHQVESATNMFPLWAGICTSAQADFLVKKLFETMVQKGGVTGTTDLRGASNPYAPQRQWDYPNGWAPHQMLIWKGLMNYGYKKEAQELIYRWLWMITKNAVDYNGTIPEKYDVVDCTHKVYAEYGNVGTEFDYITPSGFGWMNASYQLGLQLLESDLREKLDDLLDPDNVFGS